MNTTTSSSRPTPRQLSYLRALAARTATTFASPATSSDASREIERLRRLQPEPWPDRNTDEQDDGRRAAYAPAVHPDEVTGYASAAAWANTHTPAPARTRGPAGRVGELASYEVSAGRRVLWGEHADGCVLVTDRPAAGPGDRYLVDRQPASDGPGALDALLADYVAQALDLDEIPMAAGAVHRIPDDGPGR